MRVSSVARAMLLAALVIVPAAATQAQTRSRGGGPDKPDTMPATRVILLPAVDKFDVSRIGLAIKDRKLVAIFATDAPAANTLATKLQADHGGSLISFARAGRSGDDFARALVDSIIEKTARRQMERAIIVVADPELVRPFLVGAVGERGAIAADDGGPIHTFIVTVRADNRRLLVRSR